VQAAQTIKELSDANSLLSVTIQGSQSQGSRRFIISTPCGQPDIPAGHWTQASIAYNVQMGKRVLLKDSWWVLLEGIKPEGEVYTLLHENAVPNIPYCLLACNAPMGGVWPDVGKGVQLLGKSTGSYGKPETTRVH